MKMPQRGWPGLAIWAAICIVSVAICWAVSHSVKKIVPPALKPSGQVSTAPVSRITLKPTSAALSGSNQQPVPLSLQREKATALYVERLLHDHDYDWKVPLNFFGKVCDENNAPVLGATISLQWNTIDSLSGSEEKRLSSDANGLFALTGQRGKVLEVRVDKEGYYTVDGGNGALAFEFANPSSPVYYQPDEKMPILFHLRRKGEGAKLFSRNYDLPVSSRHPQVRVNLMQGFFKPDGVLTITFDTSKHLNGADAFPWTVTLNMREGGLVETDEQFPFLAPAVGYAPTVTMEMTNLDRSVWRGNMTKSYYFYLPSTNTYGRLTLDAESAARSTLTYAYNLTPGNRVLEPADK